MLISLNREADTAKNVAVGVGSSQDVVAAVLARSLEMENPRATALGLQPLVVYGGEGVEQRLDEAGQIIGIISEINQNLIPEDWREQVVSPLPAAHVRSCRWGVGRARRSADSYSYDSRNSRK